VLGSYFNEIDPFCAAWLRNLWPDAGIDERNIRNITRPVDAVRQHYFAGIGGWELALQLAGWPADREVWTGSCPCQPFSVAGKGQADEDERDLWPAFFRLIAIGRPPVIVGEQVNGAITYGWLDRVCDDLEGIGYAIGAAVLPACGVGAPHIRQRLYWVAIRLADAEMRRQRIHGSASRIPRHPELGVETGGVAQSESANGRCGSQSVESEARIWRRGLSSDSQHSGLGDSDRSRLERHLGHVHDGDQSGRFDAKSNRSAWTASDLIYCQDGRWRRIPLEPSLQPLADSGRFGNPRIDRKLSSRIGALQAAGNAIVIPLAAEFIKAVMDIRSELAA
jgi:DNA (cytosine-5)-methyltransferase 1